MYSSLVRASGSRARAHVSPISWCQACRSPRRQPAHSGSPSQASRCAQPTPARSFSAFASRSRPLLCSALPRSGAFHAPFRLSNTCSRPRLCPAFRSLRYSSGGGDSQKDGTVSDSSPAELSTVNSIKTESLDKPPDSTAPSSSSLSSASSSSSSVLSSLKSCEATQPTPAECSEEVTSPKEGSVAQASRPQEPCAQATADEYFVDSDEPEDMDDPRVKRSYRRLLFRGALVSVLIAFVAIPDHYRQQALGYVTMPLLTMFLDDDHTFGSLSTKGINERCLSVMASLCQNDAVAVRALSFYHKQLPDRLVELSALHPNAVARLVGELSRPDENRLAFTSDAWLNVLSSWASVPGDPDLVASTARVLHHLAQHHHRKKNELSRLDVQHILKLSQQLLDNLPRLSSPPACVDPALNGATAPASASTAASSQTPCPSAATSHSSVSVPASGSDLSAERPVSLQEAYQHLAGVLLALAQHRTTDTAALLQDGLLDLAQQLLLDSAPWEPSLAHTLALLSEEQNVRVELVKKSNAGWLEQLRRWALSSNREVRLPTVVVLTNLIRDESMSLQVIQTIGFDTISNMSNLVDVEVQHAIENLFYYMLEKNEPLADDSLVVPDFVLGDDFQIREYH